MPAPMSLCTSIAAPITRVAKSSVTGSTPEPARSRNSKTSIFQSFPSRLPSRSSRLRGSSPQNPSERLFFLLHFVQIRQRAFEFVLQMPHAEKTLHAREQFELVDGFADEIIRADFGGLFDVAQFIQ